MYKIVIILLLLLIIFSKYFKNNSLNIEDVYELEIKSRRLYSFIDLKDVFKKYPKKVEGLEFGYICPGAMKTIEFLNNQNTPSDILKKIKILTDFQFFVEIYQIYYKYLDIKVYNEIQKIIKDNSCMISQIITNEITILFGKLPQNIKLNIPDDFYHIRHNTLICSNSKTLANQRIKLLQSIYEKFTSECLGARDGISGCRDCCRRFNKYDSCVNDCMNY